MLPLGSSQSVGGGGGRGVVVSWRRQLMWTRGFVWDWVETGEWDPGHVTCLSHYPMRWAGLGS